MFWGSKISDVFKKTVQDVGAYPRLQTSLLNIGTLMFAVLLANANKSWALLWKTIYWYKKAVKKYYWQLISFVLPFKASIHHIAGAFTFHVNDHSHSNMQQAGFRRLRHTDDLQSEIFRNIIIPDNCFELVKGCSDKWVKSKFDNETPPELCSGRI